MITFLQHFFVIQAQSVGLYGDSFAAACVVMDENGLQKQSHYFDCPLQEATGLQTDRQWVTDKVLPNLDKASKIKLKNPQELYEKIWSLWCAAKRQFPSIYCASYMGFPITMNLFSHAVNQEIEERELLAPYPMLEIDTAFLLTNHAISPAKIPREAEELPAYNPLSDARYFARLFCLARRSIQSDGMQTTILSKKSLCGIDTKSCGLWGDVFYFGSVLQNPQEKGNEEKAAWRTWCRPEEAHGAARDIIWRAPYVDTLPKGMDCNAPHELGRDIWQWIKLAKKANALFFSWCPFPVDFRAIKNAILVKPETRPLKGIYPIHDVSTALYLAGRNPIGDYPRLEGEEKHGDPRGGARLALRLIRQATNTQSYFSEKA